MILLLCDSVYFYSAVRLSGSEAFFYSMEFYFIALLGNRISLLVKAFGSDSNHTHMRCSERS